MTITWNNAAVDPVNLYGLIPGGTAWEVPISASQMSSRSVDWTVDVAAGTTFLLLMSDAGTYGTGGSSSLMTTSNSSSGSSSCINSSSPSTTPVVPWTYASTATAVSSFTSTQSTSKGQTTANPSSSATSSAASSKKSNTAAIVGAAVGVSLAVILALLLFCCCRRRRNKDVEGAAPGAWAPVKEEREGSNNERASGGGPTAPTAPTVNERQGLLDRLFTAGVPSIGISSHSRTGSRTASGSAADTLNRGSRDLSAVAGMPYGAPAPSVFTSDSHSEIIEVSPYPYTEYSDHPPPFSAHERRRSVSSTDKAPLSDAQNSNSTDNSNDTNPENPFRDSSDLPPTLPPIGSSTPLSPVLDDDETDAEAVRRKAALGVGGVTRPTGMRTSDLLTLSEFPAPAAQGTTPSSSASNGADPRNSVHSAEHWMALTSDPPPSYNPYDRLRAANPDDHADDRSDE